MKKLISTWIIGDKRYEMYIIVTEEDLAKDLFTIEVVTYQICLN